VGGKASGCARPDDVQSLYALGVWADILDLAGIQFDRAAEPGKLRVVA
jgi:hypothetical protein